ncbi:hypothetical protein GCM10010415_68810 [Streptomyces atrovirens]|uniref:Uncharacterized protein n=1 Tax=Streptomyces atrovirens TaxID=285556 RepID=A0ABW0E2Y7_9ACTN
MSVTKFSPVPKPKIGVGPRMPPPYELSELIGVCRAEPDRGEDAERQQATEGQGAGADHPGEVGGAELESVLDVRPAGTA